MSKNKVIFLKFDVCLHPIHNAWITSEMLREGVTLELPSGREVVFLPADDGRSLVPTQNCTGYAEWLSTEHMAVIEGKVI